MSETTRYLYELINYDDLFFQTMVHLVDIMK